MKKIFKDFLTNYFFALQLLDAETQVTKQVGLLLELGKNEKALYRAAESGDRDLSKD